MNSRNKIIILAVFICIPLISYPQKKNDIKDENVVVQMNYCINSLTNIIHNKSMAVLEHESDQLVNNLTMEQIIGLYEIRDFRVELMDAVSSFEITEEERNLLRRIQSIKRDNMKWAALSNALNPTMLLTGGGGLGPQLVFQTLLTAARSIIEYKTMQGEQNIEELQAMWELRKRDMETINSLRKNALSTVFDLFNKYHLSESDRLTESTANLFSDYTSIIDASQRVRVLEDNYETYKVIPEYYYHLGMAYLDKGDFSKAKIHFSNYLNMYKRNPILRYDERSGCIALAMLTYEKTLSPNEKEDLIEIAIKNLPSNSAAVLQCALVYIYELKQDDRGFQLLRSGIDDPKASDKDLLFMAAANLLPIIKKHPAIYKDICDILNSSQNISYDSYVTFTVNSQTNAWKELVNLNNFSDCYYRKWYSLWFCKGFSKKFRLTIPENINFNSNNFFVYIEEHEDDRVSINQLKAYYKNAICEDDINDVKCFKANKNLKYLYVEVIEPDFYKLKNNIDLEKIKDETWPRQSEFVLSEDDIEDIVDFCEDNMSSINLTELQFKEIEGKEFSFSILGDIDIKFEGDSLAYEPHHSKMQKGYYFTIVLSNGLQVVYKYNEDNNILEPYYYFDGKYRHFINVSAKEEYNYIEKPIEEEPSWWSRTWTSITSWFSSDSDAEEKDKEETEKSSWWSKTWTSITGWFSSDTDEEDKSN